MKNFSIRQAVGFGWETFKSHKKLLIYATIMFGVVSLLQDVDKLFRDESGAVHFVIGVAAFIVSTIFTIGWYKFLLNIMGKGTASLKELFSYSRLLLKYLGALILFGLITGLPVAVGALLSVMVIQSVSSLPIILGVIGFAALCGLASIYFALKYHFALVLVIDKDDVGIKESFRLSARMTEEIKWKLLGFAIVLCLVNLAGALALVVGLLVSVPVSYLAYLSVYKNMLEEGK